MPHGAEIAWLTISYDFQRAFRSRGKLGAWGMGAVEYEHHVN